MSKLKLTEEGKKYLKEGLPEKKLAELLEKGSLSMAEAQKKIENLSVALQWGKKNRWVDIEDGKLVLVKKPVETVEKYLEKIEKKEPIPENILKILFQRKLAVEERENERKKAEAFVGKEIDKLTPELIKTGLWKETKLKPYNVEFIGKRIYSGKRQPYNIFLDSVRRKLIELGFIECRGQAIVQEFWNFDALYQPQGHPARDWTDVYTLKYPKKGSLPDPKLVERVKETHENGWKTGSTGWGYAWSPEKAAHLMPIAHDTAVSPKILASKDLKIPGKYFQIVRCYRPDILDATHLIEFNQVGGFIVGEDLNFRNLLGVLKMFAHEVAGAEQAKFTAGYFPFTEPSCEISAKHPELGWIEIGGAGIFREELTKPLGVDYPVIAWGIGIDRLAMFKLGLKDARSLFTSDLKLLREQKVLI